MHHRKGVFEAGCSQDAGRVIAPKINMIVDRKDTSGMSKADALLPAEGSSPDHTMASGQDTTGVQERGMYPQG